MLPIERLFTFVYFTERTALDELALDERSARPASPGRSSAKSSGARSFDLLAAYTERAQLEPTEAAIIDKLTTLHTRPMFDAVLAKELERAGRFGYVDLVDSVRRRSAVDDQPGARLRRRRQDSRAAGHSRSGSTSGSTTGWRGTRRIRSRCC